MEDNRSNMIRLVSTVDFAANVKAAESYALQEEKQNAKNNYAVLEKRYKQLENAMPYPDRGEFDTGIDLEDIDRIQSEKRANKPWVDEKKQLYKYISKDELYTGHVRMYHTEDYYIMEDTSLESMLLDKNSRCRLINADDKNFQDAVRALANPQKNSAVVFSRAIEMKNREVTNVRIAFDRESKVLSTITDSYLRNALIRNKSKVGLQSIIQTIQEKQDEIRLQKKDASFIVQGCAGSGKTMVLLHRLRYLIFNKAIYPEDYLILVPSTEFKSYIREVSANFGIQQKTIQSYTEYYESVVERKSSCETNENELVFPAEYLSRIYSEKFIQECYREFFNAIFESTDRLITACEEKLTAYMEHEQNKIKEDIQAIQNSVIAAVNVYASSLLEPQGIKFTGNFDDIAAIISDIGQICKKGQERYNQILMRRGNIRIEPDDLRITDNAELKHLKEEIKKEELLVQKAFIFTARAHKNKLGALNERYTEAYSALEARLIEAERARVEEEIQAVLGTFGNLGLAGMLQAYEEIAKTYRQALERIDQLEKRAAVIADVIEEKHKEDIDNLRSVINRSVLVEKESCELVQKLAPAHEFLKDYVTRCKQLHKFLLSLCEQADQSELREKFMVFAERTEAQQLGYLTNMLFNLCRKKIRAEYNIRICDAYKHYWYLRAYVQYLIHGSRKEWKKYIFVDEAQDLSVAEHKLILKMNSILQAGKRKYPTMNLFGDINQTISPHGMKSWDELSKKIKVYALEENFRNTNQIIDFCNEKLPFKMEKVGVDMAPVSVFPSVLEAVKGSKKRALTFVVKDEYARRDLSEILNEANIQEFAIYTVKEVKGLEFREVYVCDREMSNNEKYIAYTRALSDLHIIERLPQTVTDRESLVIQGEDPES